MRVTGSLRERILSRLADPESFRILASVLKEGKSAIAIGNELNLPSSTLYRKISDLKDCGLLMTDTFIVRPDGKKEARYACTFKEIIFRPSPEDTLDLELIPTRKSLEKSWFDLFFSK